MMVLRFFVLLTVLSFVYVQASSTISSANDIQNLQSLTNDMKNAKRWRPRGRKPVESTTATSFKESTKASTTETFLNENEEILHHRTNFIAECDMPTDLGLFKMRSYTYQSPTQTLEPIAMVYGNIQDQENVLVRVHDQCFTSEVFGSLRCDCREQLKESLKMIKEHGGGVVIYLQQEGRGIGIANKIAAYSLQDQGMDTVDANTHLGFRDELREYYSVPDVLKDLNIKSIRLMTNNPYKINQLKQLGVKINERIPIQVMPNQYNEKYLRSKKEKMNHYLTEEVLTSSVDQNGKNQNQQSGLLLSRTGRRLAKQKQQQQSVTSDSEIKVLASNAPLETLTATPKIEYALGKETVVAAINAVREGKIVIVVDDADRENEGDLIMAAEKATPETIGFMVRYTSGVICVSLDAERLDYLGLPPMVVNNEDPKQTAYTISVDAKHPDVTTGISASDRAITFQKLVDPTATKDDFQRPGHVFPLRYKEGGVIRRAGHTEASLDLTKLAGLRHGGVLAEIVRDDGSMMRLPELKEMAKQFNLVLTSVQDIKAYRMETEDLSELK